MGLKHWVWRIFYFYAGLLLLFVIAVSLIATAGGGEHSALVGIWFAAAVAIVAGLGMTWYCCQRMVVPFEQLTYSLRAAAAGDGELPVSLDGGDEAAVLSAAFQQMQRRLDRRVGQIQDNTVRLQTMLGSMVEGVLAVGPDKTILLANEAGRQLLDFATAEPVGRSLLEVTRARPVYEAVEQSLTSEAPVEREFESPGRQRRTLALRATRLPGDSSPGVMIVLHDVSELRRLENLRRELVANVSHELKTPLAAIKAYAETLRMGAVNDPENNLAFVGRIEEQAERLHMLILDMLQIARVESGQETFEIVDVPVADLLEECLAQFSDLAAAKQISLRAELPPLTLTVRADEEGLRTILNNLVDNAVKYTPAGGATTICCRLSHDTVVLEVKDTGIGIAAHDQSRIFERFYRVDKARSRELGGTGLGLSIVKHLAQAFGGSITLESELRRGSTFRLQLPRGQDSYHP